MPGFQVRGGALKENAKKSDFFQWRREARKFLGYIVWKITILRQKIIFFPILGGSRAGGAPPLDPPLQLAAINVRLDYLLPGILMPITCIKRKMVTILSVWSFFFFIFTASANPMCYQTFLTPLVSSNLFCTQRYNMKSKRKRFILTGRKY